MTLLTNPDVANDPKTGEPWSDRAIARWCKVDHKTVSKCRAGLTGEIPSEKTTTRTYTNKHGTTSTMDIATAV